MLHWMMQAFSALVFCRHFALLAGLCGGLVLTGSGAWARTRSSNLEASAVCPPASVCWSNPSGGDWNVPTNWAGGEIPAAGSDVVIDVASLSAPVTITGSSVTLGSLTLTKSLTIQDGVVAVTGNLVLSAGAVFTVQGASASATISGAASVSGATLNAVSGGSMLLPGLGAATGTVVSVSSGGVFSAVSLSSLTAGRLVVRDPTSQANLPALTNVDDTGLISIAGGQIALPGVLAYSFHGSPNTGNLCVQVCAKGAGSLVRLPALQTISATRTTGTSGLVVEASSSTTPTARVQLPALTTINTPDQTSVTFNAVGNSAVIELSVLTNQPATVSLVMADGGGIDAPNLTAIDGPVVMSGSGNGFHTGSVTRIGRTFQVAGPALSYPLVTDLTNVELSISASGQLTLGGVTTAAGTTVTITSGSLSLPALTALTGGVLSVATPATLTAPALANLDNTRVILGTSTRLSFPGVTSYTLSQTLIGGSDAVTLGSSAVLTLSNLTALVANGRALNLVVNSSAARLEMPALTSIQTSTSGSVRMTANAGSSFALGALVTLPPRARIDLSGGVVNAAQLTTLLGDVSFSGSTSRLNSGAIRTIDGLFQVSGLTLAYPQVAALSGSTIQADSSGSITLASVTTATSATLKASGGTVSVPSLTTATDTSLLALAGGSIWAPSLVNLRSGRIAVTNANSLVSTPALVTIDDTTLQGSEGGGLSLPAVQRYRFSEAESANEIESAGTSSVINLPSLTTIEATGQAVAIVAKEFHGSGRINMPALTAFDIAGGGSVALTATGAGTVVDLDSLAELPPLATLSILSGGRINVARLTSLAGSVAMSGAANTFNAGPIDTIAGSLTVAGTSLSYPLVQGLPGGSVTAGSAGSLTLDGVATASNAVLAATGGTLALPSLLSTTDTTVTMSRGSLSAPALTTMTSGRIAMSGGTLNAPALANIDNTTLQTTSGGTLDLPGVSSYRFDEAYSGGSACSSATAIVCASGGNTTVTLANVRILTIDGSSVDVAAGWLQAGGGRVNLPQLTTVNTVHNGSVRFAATGSAAIIDLGSLAGSPPGVAFAETSGGRIIRPATTCVDADLDGYGTGGSSGCTFADVDCNDANPTIHPGALEACNGVDENCDGQIDEGVTTTFHPDSDGDGFGAPGASVQACTSPAGYVSNGADCDDGNVNVNPSKVEVPGNGIDDDCNADTSDCRDLDRDGYGNPASAACAHPEVDCNDSSASVNPGRTEIPSNGIDDDCNAATPGGCSAP